MGRIGVSIAMLVLWGCVQTNEQDQKDRGAAAGDTARVREISPDEASVSSASGHYEYNDFKDFYRNFFISLMEDNEVRFNTFINPKRGLYIIDSKGAMPQLVHVQDISSYKRQDGRSVFSIDKSTLGFEMLNEPLPVVDCDLPGSYDKMGCFTQRTNRLMETMIWQYADLDEKTFSDVVSLAETVSVTVINTANYAYYFSFIDGNWYLTFLDIRRPCEA